MVSFNIITYSYEIQPQKMPVDFNFTHQVLSKAKTLLHSSLYTLLRFASIGVIFTERVTYINRSIEPMYDDGKFTA